MSSILKALQRLEKDRDGTRDAQQALPDELAQDILRTPDEPEPPPRPRRAVLLLVAAGLLAMTVAGAFAVPRLLDVLTSGSGDAPEVVAAATPPAGTRSPEPLARSRNRTRPGTPASPWPGAPPRGMRTEPTREGRADEGAVAAEPAAKAPLAAVATSDAPTERSLPPGSAGPEEGSPAAVPDKPRRQLFTARDRSEQGGGERGDPSRAQAPAPPAAAPGEAPPETQRAAADDPPSDPVQSAAPPPEEARLSPPAQPDPQVARAEPAPAPVPPSSPPPPQEPAPAPEVAASPPAEEAPRIEVAAAPPSAAPPAPVVDAAPRVEVAPAPAPVAVAEPVPAPSPPAVPAPSASRESVAPAAGSSNVAVARRAPSVVVRKTVWHPKAERRLTEVSLEGRDDRVVLREGDAVASLVVVRIEPSGVVFRFEDREIRKVIGAP